MTARAQQHTAQVLRRTRVSAHLVRLVLGGPGLADFTSTGIPDEWVGLVVPDQFQSRYYTVRSWRDGELTLDIVLHDVGLVAEWARRDCVGETVVVTDPKGSFDPPADAGWLILVGDLTALPAMARILETTDLPTRVWAEAADRLDDYLPAGADVTWLTPPGEDRSMPRGGGHRDRLARRRRLLLDGGGVGADAGDPQAPDAGGAAAEHRLRRDGLLARRDRPPAPSGRPGADLALGQGRRQERRRDLGRLRQGA